jgi:hypothetical protein
MTIEQFIAANPTHPRAIRAAKIMAKPARAASARTWARDGAFIGRLMRDLISGAL